LPAVRSISAGVNGSAPMIPAQLLVGQAPIAGVDRPEEREPALCHAPLTPERRVRRSASRRTSADATPSDQLQAHTADVVLLTDPIAIDRMQGDRDDAVDRGAGIIARRESNGLVRQRARARRAG
jgi:hypothetical protein